MCFILRLLYKYTKYGLVRKNDDDRIAKATGTLTHRSDTREIDKTCRGGRPPLLASLTDKNLCPAPGRCPKSLPKEIISISRLAVTTLRFKIDGSRYQLSYAKLIASQSKHDHERQKNTDPLEYCAVLVIRSLSHDGQWRRSLRY